MIRKDSCFDLDLPKFAKLHFMSYYMIYSGDCFMCICEECEIVLCAFVKNVYSAAFGWNECSINVC